MNEPTFESPIPTPDGHVLNRNDIDADEVYSRPWKQAPSIVRGGAYPVALLYGFFGLIFMLIGLLPDEGSGEKVAIVIGGLILVGLTVWLCKGFKNHSKTVWRVQIVLSCIGILGFPLGTIIHGFILSQWFSPETKAWFGIK
jgi:hypothetical protein